MIKHCFICGREIVKGTGNYVKIKLDNILRLVHRKCGIINKSEVMK